MNPTDTATLISLLTGGQPGASKTPDLINQYIQSDSILPPQDQQQQQSQQSGQGLLGNPSYGMLGQAPPSQSMSNINPYAGY